MSIYAISDLHLSISMPDKSMSVFGDVWRDYEKKIEENWKKTVKEEDTVLIPGDISWAMNLEDAVNDFAFIESLPGKKIIIKGNHDFYFSTVTKLNKFFKDNHFYSIQILHNDSYFVDGVNVCGTRGWKQGPDATKEDHKIFQRELIRLRLSLDSIKKENKDKDIIVGTHFPPFEYNFKNILKEYKVKKCVYGHLHGDGHYMVKQMVEDGVEYIMVGGDYTGFKLVKLA